MSIVHADFSIERNYDCSPAHAFRGFSDPDLKRQWFANPAGTYHDIVEDERMLFTEQGAFFDDLDQPAEREHGTGWLLDRLGRVLAGESVR